MTYSVIFGIINDVNLDISDAKEMLSSINKDLVHIESRILQAQEKDTHEHIPTMVTVRKYLLQRQRISQEQLDNLLNYVTNLRKKIFTC